MRPSTPFRRGVWRSLIAVLAGNAIYLLVEGCAEGKARAVPDRLGAGGGFLDLRGYIRSAWVLPPIPVTVRPAPHQTGKQAFMNRNEVVRLSREYGGAWIVGHAERLLQLMETIGEGLEYDRGVIWLAAYLHDWGACPKWAREGVSHSVRSCEVAGAYLQKAGCSKKRAAKVLEAIRFHHGGSADRSTEAVLLSDADALDSLGVLGVLKEFAMIPAEVKGDYCIPRMFGLREAYERARIRRENLPNMLRLETSRALAAQRIEDMDRMFALLERDTFGRF